MLHAREDYQDRIQDSAGLIPEDEPVLIIRGQDLAAVPAARAWCQTADDLGADPRLVQQVEDHIGRIEEWQQTHNAKVPDLPAAVS